LSGLLCSCFVCWLSVSFFNIGANVPQIGVVADLRSGKLSTELETNI